MLCDLQIAASVSFLLDYRLLIVFLGREVLFFHDLPILSGIVVFRMDDGELRKPRIAGSG
jgi:hypothetical protein